MDVVEFTESYIRNVGGVLFREGDVTYPRNGYSRYQIIQSDVSRFRLEDDKDIKTCHWMVKAIRYPLGEVPVGLQGSESCCLLQISDMVESSGSIS